MSYPPRLQLDCGCYHVIQRGECPAAELHAMASLRRDLYLTYARIGDLPGGATAPGVVQAIRQAEAESASDLQAVERSLFT